MPSELRVVASIQDLAQEAAGLFVDWCTRAISTRGRCHLALSGGSTPRPVHALLASPPLRDRIDWSRVDFYFGDERKVPAAHPDSNFRMARQALLDPLAIPAAQIHRMEAEREDGDTRYEAVLPERLDVLVLGIGPDGHTASLFPGDPTGIETDRRVCWVTGPKPPFERLTITAKVIRQARQILVLVSGREKAPAVGRSLRGALDPIATPAQLARAGVWLVTADAAPQTDRPG